jgi:hypothetical protein
MRRLVALFIVLGFAGSAVPARAGDAWSCNDTAYWCTRDAIYEQFKLIAHLEANPDVDDGVKGPAITAARAEIHRLRATIHEPPPRDWVTIASPQRAWATPCCYARQPIHIR